jgi:hypothetical protein
MTIRDIGLLQGRRLANMNYSDRLAFIAEGLPVIVASCRELMGAAKMCANERAKGILERHAAEEAVKALILLDVARCPASLIARRIGPLMSAFYDHMARLLWADACHWCAATLGELQGYLDHDRQTHYLDGPMGVDFIFPNEALDDRNSLLYADIASYEDGGLVWSAPRADHSYTGMLLFSVNVVEALNKAGALTQRGLEILADVWGQIEFEVCDTSHDVRGLIHQTLQALHGAGLMSADLTDDDVQEIYQRWQMPMYNADFRPIHVTMEDVERKRAAALAAEMGY